MSDTILDKEVSKVLVLASKALVQEQVTNFEDAIHYLSSFDVAFWLGSSSEA